MAKMRVFELARELNVPGKDLITIIETLGVKVDGNFNVLDEDQIAKIRTKMAEPRPKAKPAKKDPAVKKAVESEALVAKESAAAPKPEVPEVPEAPAAPEEAIEEATAAPQKQRRVISASRSKEAIKTGPDSEKAKPVLRKRRVVTEAEPEPPVEEAPPAEEIAAGEPVAEPVPPESEVVVEQEPVEVPAPAVTAGQSAPVAAEKEPFRFERKISKEPEAEGRPGEKGKWRDVKRGERKSKPGAQRDEWVRPPKRKGDRRGGRAQKVRRDSDQLHVFGPRKKAIRIGQAVTVSELASAIGVKGGAIIKKLFELGITASINEPIEGATAELIATEYGIEIEVDTRNLEDLVKEESMDPDKMTPRPPIVTIMGHVDHGKTSLLDYIRSSHIASGEAGGITQQIGAYYVRSAAGDVVFLDTPGHAAFTAMRARGADVTDLVILVVAADDGLMPQTIEAIDHARAANVPIIVAANKIDRPNANVDRVKQQLMEHDLLAEEFGGDTVVIPVSAQTGEGIPQLLEIIHLQAEMLEIQSVSEGQARGYVIESRMDRQRGPVATVLIQRGTLHVGDDFVAGSTHGRVRAMYDDLGKPITEAGPSIPVEVLGYNEMPAAGDIFVVMEDEKVARQIAQVRANRQRVSDTMPRRQVRLEDFLQGITTDEVRNLNVVLKADTQGSLEAIRGALEKQGNEQVKVQIIRAGVGGISETDVSLASTSEAVVIGFNVRAQAKADELALAGGVDIKRYMVIYELIDDIHAALEGMLKPIEREEVIGRCEVRQIFAAGKDTKIAGAYVTDGHFDRSSNVRLFREDVLVYTGHIQTLRRFKEDVQNVQSGYECGVRIADFNDIKEGDQIEAFITIEEAPRLERAE